MNFELLSIIIAISNTLTGLGIVYLIVLTHIKSKQKVEVIIPPAPSVIVPEITIPTINISGFSKAGPNVFENTDDRFKTVFIHPKDSYFNFYIIEDLHTGFGYLVAEDENGNKVAPTKIYLCHENH